MPTIHVSTSEALADTTDDELLDEIRQRGIEAHLCAQADEDLQEDLLSLCAAVLRGDIAEARVLATRYEARWQCEPAYKWAGEQAEACTQ
jgi:hypothetical protein